MRDARLLLAIRLWHLFANPSVDSFDEETHKAEYIFAIDQLPTCLLLRLIVGRLFRQYEKVGS
jgi:hypothetical protein